MAKWKKPKWHDIIKKAADDAHWHYASSAEVINLRNLLKRYRGFGHIKKWHIRYYEGDEFYGELIGGEMTVCEVEDYQGNKYTFPS